MQKKITDRIVVVPGTGVDRHAGGLVQHQKVRVLIDDVQRPGGGHDPAAPLRVRQADGQHLPRPGDVPGIHPPAIHQDAIGQPFDPADYRSGQAQMPFQQGVHPDPRQLRPHRQVQTAAHRASSRVAKKK